MHHKPSSLCAGEGAVNENGLPAGLGNSELSVDPNNQAEPASVDFVHPIRSGSLSASVADAVSVTWPPAATNTLGPIESTGKLFSLGENRCGLGMDCATLRRPAVELVLARVSLSVS